MTRRVAYRELERSGRLGNQLWQIASTVGIARRHGAEPAFPEDWSYRPYFEVPDEWFVGPADLEAALPVQEFSALPPAQRPYLQQWEYVAPVLEEVKAAFTATGEAEDMLSEHLAATHQEHLIHLTEPTISLHVRRGDNTDLKTHPIGTWPLVTLDYYAAAIDALGAGEVVVFSDDIPWCRINLPGVTDRRLHFVEDGPQRGRDYVADEYLADPPLDWIDMRLMGLTEKHIIANSTYSLWGAVLAGGPTVYPDNWVGWRIRDALPAEATMVPPEWQCVHNPVDAKHLRRRP